MQFKRAILINSRLEVGRTGVYSYRIWDSKEWDEDYGVIQLEQREVKKGKDDIILVSGDVHGDW